MINDVVPLYRDPLTGFWNLFYLGAGKLGVLTTHQEDECSSERCDIHNRPEELSNYALQWRNDRKILEQVCKHGVGHPSPSEVAHSRAIGRREGHLTHGCCPDSCCLGWVALDD